MKNMTLQNIADAVKGKLILPEGISDVEALLAKTARGVVIDNRNVEQDFLFIPIKGARVDGHSFIPAAFDSGAIGVLSERELSSDEAKGAYILVESTERALKDLAAYYRAQLSIPIIGIIGSVGKTSTKEMTASVLTQHFSVLKTEGNFNNEIGLPLTLFRINETHEAAVVEMGISDFGEMHRLAEMARPTAVIFTNIGQCHLENLKTRDGILQAKTEVLSRMTLPATVIANGDDDKLATIGELPAFRELSDATLLFYGMGSSLENAKRRFAVVAENVAPNGLQGVTATLKTAQGDVFADIPLPGIHNVYNAMAATAAGLSLGMTTEEIERGIAAVKTIGGRSNFIEKDGITIIDDCYNANPQSMKASLAVLSEADGRKIAVLGDMGELGADEKKLHYEIGQTAAKCGIDELYLCGELAAEIKRGAKDGATEEIPIHHYLEKSELIADLKQHIKKGDAVLVKASHFMEFPEIVEALTETA